MVSSALCKTFSYVSKTKSDVCGCYVLRLIAICTMQNICSARGYMKYQVPNLHTSLSNIKSRKHTGHFYF